MFICSLYYHIVFAVSTRWITTPKMPKIKAFLQKKCSNSLVFNVKELYNIDIVEGERPLRQKIFNPLGRN